ncbi:hypothetical protein BDZ89DRAFT_1089502 [Hymenopellis radicata]|nr:hypothetical protein BDZ89DRAFT_1089502 [Hymenopellis radicata]
MYVSGIPSVTINETPSFRINKAEKSYHHQYSNIYYHRLKGIRASVEEQARQRWRDVDGSPVLVPRVLEIVKNKLCWIVGTVYLDMPLKPNVLVDIARDHSIPPPPPPTKFCSPEDTIMLEDESGRLKLVGERIKAARLVTGVVMGVLGMETMSGDFEVVDIFDRGEDAMDVDENNVEDLTDEWIAVVSGLSVGSSTSPDASLEMLTEYLSGEEGGVDDQLSAAQISRLIIAGNSFAPASKTEPVKSDPDDKKTRGRYGQDASAFSPHPTSILSGYLQDVGSVMPIHILPGENDPCGAILPQQPFPRAMMGPVSSLPSFSCETNPTYLRLGAGAEERTAISRTILVNSGQPLNDMFKYLASPPATRLSILESTLRWRHMAPTAPDTLWCHPYHQSDPFLFHGTPDGRFATKLALGEDGKTQCRLVLVPDFASTGTLVLVNMRTLEVRTRSFRTYDAAPVKMETR